MAVTIPASKYTISVRVTSGVPEPTTRTYEVKGQMISDALQKLCKKCMCEDDTGAFFEMEDADLNYFMKVPGFHIVDVAEGKYGVVIEDLKVEVPERDRYLCALRAKRERLGLSIPVISGLLGEPSYKSKETGNREMTLSDYSRFMRALDGYEAEMASSLEM